MKKCIDITCLLLASILLSVVCLSAAPAAPSGGASGLRVALLLEDAAPDQGWNDLLRQGLEQARKEATAFPRRPSSRLPPGRPTWSCSPGPGCTRSCATMPPTSGRRSSAASIRAYAPPTS